MNENRRRFLKTSLLTASGGAIAAQAPPVQSLLNLMFKDFLKQAKASGPQSRANYLAFHFLGGPARWSFDQFLQTEMNQTLLSNSYVATHLSGDQQTYSRTEFATFDYQGFPLPMLWQTPLRTHNNSLRPMLDLIPHLISFRGYGTGVDGHLANSARQTNPVPSAGSITGHVADSSDCLFRALQFPPLNGWSGYQSIRSTGLTLVAAAGKANYTANLFSPFTFRNDSLALAALQSKYSSSINEVHKQIRFVASQRMAGLDALDLDFQNSLKTIKNGIEDLESSWNTLYSKYEALILGNIKDRSVPGLSDKPIIAANDPSFNTFVVDKTLRPNVGSDIRDWLNNVDCNQLISAFALAEFVLVRGHSTALEFGDFPPANLQGAFNESSEISSFSFNFDQHTSGSVPTTFVNAMFFRAFSAALLELIDQLKINGLFENTFIHLAQEFGRTPLADGSGSDHGFDAMMSTVVTGANNSRPIVVGNILRSGVNGNYPGTFGEKALTRVGADYVSLTPAHLASTLASLMQFETNPWANVAAPLIVRSGSSLTTLASGEIV